MPSSSVGARVLAPVARRGEAAERRRVARASSSSEAADRDEPTAPPCGHAIGAVRWPRVDGIHASCLERTARPHHVDATVAANDAKPCAYGSPPSVGVCQLGGVGRALAALSKPVPPPVPKPLCEAPPMPPSVTEAGP
eukprot:scaffold21681_cov27-Tisochrysis_lutea.AAC.8